MMQRIDRAMAAATDRRSFLGLATATAAAGAAGAAFARTDTDSDAMSPTAGDKFYADGRVHPFAGNTIICHLAQQGEDAVAFRALLDIYRAAPGMDFMRKITLLPPSSYHMTVFSGANDAQRTTGLWPRTVPLDAPKAECDHRIGAMLRDFALETALPIRMAVDPAEPPADDMPFKIRLVGADSGEEHKLRWLRDRLSDHLGIRAPTHDAYYFHISLGYLIQPFTPAERTAFLARQAAWRAMVRHAAPVIVLGAPEYCTFRDMFAFDQQFYLR
jgi:hypothetical protein